MNYELPESIKVGGVDHPIMWDYRPILDVLTVLEDKELTERDRVLTALYIFYPNMENIPSENMEEAAQKCFWFINGGNDEQAKKAPKLMDWEQDFPYIVAPINRVLGEDIRKGNTETNPVHWWTVLSAYYEIGDCTLAQIVRIRDLKSRNKKMDKADREWYANHRELVDFKRKYTDKEQELLENWS